MTDRGPNAANAPLVTRQKALSRIRQTNRYPSTAASLARLPGPLASLRGHHVSMDSCSGCNSVTFDTEPYSLHRVDFQACTTLRRAGESVDEN